MPAKLTLNSFIEKSNNIHDFKYNYSKVVYKTNNEHVIIICPIHGEFSQRPRLHLSKAGCKLCGNSIISKNLKMSLEEFIKKSKEIHDNRYDYSKTILNGSATKIEIICPIHGSFWKSPNKHLQKQGCKNCSNIIKNGKIRLDLSEFINRSNIIHKHKYNYSKTVYHHSRIKVCIICPNHGEFFQVPESHMKGEGCRKCNSSKGEILIENILNKNNIKYIKEKCFDDLRSPKNGKLRFDFYLPDFNCCIEFDGIYHFPPTEKMLSSKSCRHSFDMYMETKFRDIIKNNYCNYKSIKLIRIPYFKFKTINEIINNHVLIEMLARSL